MSSWRKLSHRTPPLGKAVSGAGFCLIPLFRCKERGVETDSPLQPFQATLPTELMG